ncbi:hypothetical protein CSKR_200998 [Clonorchis sinensis]|uniref:Uncharacterized protein n=1 Tax=Clonorchis sinensis TaxID=79923 RepID=A0A8T1MKA9_CLOSI|nr:hypothetical protein CSKR_200998 [Clonorchis sinensis]
MISNKLVVAFSLCIFWFSKPCDSDHTSEIRLEIGSSCKGPQCTIPFPKFCASTRVQCVQTHPLLEKLPCTTVAVLDCKCPPPRKSYYGGSLPCLYRTQHIEQLYTYQYAVELGKDLGTVLDPQDVLRAVNIKLLGRSPSFLPCNCDKTYSWCAWESWSEWSLVCNGTGYKHRRRTRGCCPTSGDDWITSHLCHAYRSGDPNDNRTEVEMLPTVDCPNRSKLLDPYRGQAHGSRDYALLAISVVLLCAIVVTIALIMKVVSL